LAVNVNFAELLGRCPTSRRLVACSSRGLLAAALALLSGGFQLAIAFCVDLLLTPRQHVS